jgi:hypothetical protein
MSVLSPDVHSALTQLLQGLQSADNTIRTQAETNLNNDWVNQQPDVLLLGLVEQLGQSSDEGVSLQCDWHSRCPFAFTAFGRVLRNTPRHGLSPPFSSAASRHARSKTPQVLPEAKSCSFT